MTTLRTRVSDALRSQGFARHGRAHIRRVDDDFSVVVDTGPLGPRTDIAPVVGIRSDAVERARAELMSLEDIPWLGTVGANVGYVLTGEYRWWDEGAPLQTILDDIAAGLDVFKPYMTLATLGGAFGLNEATAHNPGTPYALVVVALLNRDTPGVIRHLAHAESILCTRDDEVCEQFREFETRVRSRLADSTS